MSLSKKETKLFDALRDEGFDNFLLVEIRGRPIICADHSELQDGTELEPLYGRLSESEAATLLQALDEGTGEDDEGGEETERRAERPAPKRWRG